MQGADLVQHLAGAGCVRTMADCILIVPAGSRKGAFVYLSLPDVRGFPVAHIFYHSAVVCIYSVPIIILFIIIIHKITVGVYYKSLGLFVKFFQLLPNMLADLRYTSALRGEERKL